MLEGATAGSHGTDAARRYPVRGELGGGRGRRPAELLVADGNPADVRLVVEALRLSPIPTRLSVARDGHEALAFLRRTAPHEARPRPDLMLLELDLPYKDGREVLAEVKGDETLKTIPVVVLTNSDAVTDVALAYRLHANCYVAKPVDLDAFLSAVAAIVTLWLEVARPHPS